ncbi:MAG: CAP domain-containing protein [Haloarculaceae archaeon]
MVNKVVVGIVGLIVLTAMLVGALVGTQLGGTGSAGPATNATATPTATAAPTATATGTPTAPGTGGQTATSTPTATATATSTPTANGSPTPTPERRIDPGAFDAATIEDRIEAGINDRREARGLDPLQTEGATASHLRRMARNHSATMAETGEVTNDAGGNSSAQRFRQNDLFQTCKFATGSGVIKPAHDNFETVGRTIAGRPYQEDDRRRFNANETAVAGAVVGNWFGSDFFRPRLTYENAGRLGVGVVVTDDGEVYATAEVCGP